MVADKIFTLHVWPVFLCMFKCLLHTYWHVLPFVCIWHAISSLEFLRFSIDVISFPWGHVEISKLLLLGNLYEICKTLLEKKAHTSYTQSDSTQDLTPIYLNQSMDFGEVQGNAYWVTVGMFRESRRAKQPCSLDVVMEAFWFMQCGWWSKCIPLQYLLDMHSTTLHSECTSGGQTGHHTYLCVRKTAHTHTQWRMTVIIRIVCMRS